MGWYNVDAMLASAPAGQLKGWEQFYEEEPFGDAWRQASTIAAVVANEVRLIAASFGGEKLKDGDLYDFDQFMPVETEADRRKAQELDKQLAAADAIEGFGF